jgi:hypothetical protein
MPSMPYSELRFFTKSPTCIDNLTAFAIPAKHLTSYQNVSYNGAIMIMSDFCDKRRRGGA